VNLLRNEFVGNTKMYKSRRYFNRNDDLIENYANKESLNKNYHGWF